MVSTMRIGLTGGIGSGKTTVAGMFEQLGVPVLDLDKAGNVLLKKKSLVQQLVQQFGKQILTEDRQINRKALAKAAFVSAEGTEQLNAIMHPAIRDYETVWVNQHADAPYVIIEASVLIESGGAPRMNQVMVVMADEAIRKKRVLARGEQDEKMFEHIISRQCDDQQRFQIADEVIYNDGSLEELMSQVQHLHQKLFDSSQA